MRIDKTYIWQAELEWGDGFGSSFQFISDENLVTHELLDTAKASWGADWYFKNPVTDDNRVALTLASEGNDVGGWMGRSDHVSNGESTTPTPVSQPPAIRVVSLRLVSGPYFGTTAQCGSHEICAVRVENNRLVFDPERIEKLINER